VPEEVPETVAVRETLFKGAVPELGEAERATPKMRTSTESGGALPPGPVQLIVKVVVEVRLPEKIPVLEVPLLKAEPFLVTLQEVALVEVQLIVAAVLLVMEIGPSEVLALMSAVGAEGAVQVKSRPLAALLQPLALQACTHQP